MVNVQPLTSAELATLPLGDQLKYKAATDEEKRQIEINFRNKDSEPTNGKGTSVETNTGNSELTPEQIEAKRLAEQKAQEEIQRAKNAATTNFLGNIQGNGTKGQPVAQDPNANNNAELRRLQKENEKLKAQLAQQPEVVDDEVVEKPVAENRPIVTAYAPDVLNEFERNLAEQAVEDSGSNAPLYKNAEAKRKLKLQIQKEMYDKLQNAVEENENADAKTVKAQQRLAKRVARQGARTMAKNIAIGDKIEHTRIVDSQQEKREMRDDMTRKERREIRVRTHVKPFIKEENVTLHTIMDEKGISSHEAAIELVEDNSGDRRFEPNEVRRTASESSNTKSRDKRIETELRRLGFEVKDDTWKNILAGISTGALTAAGAGSLPIILTAAKDVVEKFQWGITVETNVDVKGVVWPTAQAALAGGISAIMAGALFGGTEDEDALHGNAVEQIFKDDPNGKRAWENISFGTKAETEKVKLVLQAIDNLDLSDDEKTGILAAAAGEDGQQILSKKELVLAYVNATLKSEEEQEIADVIKCPETDTEIESETEIETETEIESDTDVDNDTDIDTDVDNDSKPKQDNTPKNGGVVTVMNGESFNRIAKKYGVDVNKLKDLNEEKIHSYKDCNNNRHYFFRVGEQITLPDGANQEAVKYNQENVKREQEIGKYTRAVTSEKNIKKLADENCIPKQRAQGDQVDKLVKEEQARRAATQNTQRQEIQDKNLESAKTNDSVPVTVNDSVPVTVNDSVPVTVNDSVPVIVNDSVPVTVNDSVPVTVNDSVPVTVNDSVPVIVNDSVPVTVNDSQKITINNKQSIQNNNNNAINYFNNLPRVKNNGPNFVRIETFFNDNRDDASRIRYTLTKIGLQLDKEDLKIINKGDFEKIRQHIQNKYNIIIHM